MAENLTFVSNQGVKVGWLPNALLNSAIEMARTWTCHIRDKDSMTCLRYEGAGIVFIECMKLRMAGWCPSLVLVAFLGLQTGGLVAFTLDGSSNMT